MLIILFADGEPRFVFFIRALLSFYLFPVTIKFYK